MVGYQGLYLTPQVVIYEMINYLLVLLFILQTLEWFLMQNIISSQMNLKVEEIYTLLLKKNNKFRRSEICIAIFSGVFIFTIAVVYPVLVILSYTGGSAIDNIVANYIMYYNMTAHVIQIVIFCRLLLNLKKYHNLEYQLNGKSLKIIFLVTFINRTILNVRILVHK